MTDDRKSGVALIAGSLGGLLTMAIHPTHAAAVLTPPQLLHLAIASAIAHSLAMISYLGVFLGTIGLSRHLDACESLDMPDRLALAALTVYAFASVALLLATAVSGFIVPGIVRDMIRDSPANSPLWKIVIDAVFQFNQVFARIYSVAASAAILLWSASVLRNGGLGRGIAMYGCIVTPPLIVLLAIGHLRLDVHGMTVVVVAHAVWFIVAGAQLGTPRAHHAMARQSGAPG